MMTLPPEIVGHIRQMTARFMELLACPQSEFRAIIEAENPFIHHVLSEAVEL